VAYIFMDSRSVGCGGIGRWGHRLASVGAAVWGPVGAAVRASAIGGGCGERRGLRWGHRSVVGGGGIGIFGSCGGLLR
jgi:hypothetical protein